MSKRLFDIVFSTAGLVILSPVLLCASLLIKVNSPGPVFFKQERIGRGFRPFWIYKLRTMRQLTTPILRYNLWDVEARTAGVLSMATGKNDILPEASCDEPRSGLFTERAN